MNNNLYESLERLFLAVNYQRTAHLAMVDPERVKADAEKELSNAMYQARDAMNAHVSNLPTRRRNDTDL